MKGKVTTAVDGNRLTVTVTPGTGEVSSTGKSMVMASTGGFIAVAGTEYRLNLVLIKKV